MIAEATNILSAILATIATVYLFITANKCSKELKTGFMLSAVGILIALAIHSFAEFLEAFGYISIETLSTIMPILVLIGSVILIIGIYKLYNVINREYNKV